MPVKRGEGGSKKVKTVKTVTTVEEKHPKKKSSKRVVSEKIELSLAKNIIELQKIHTNMIEKFDKLSDQLTVLLNLFESTARTFASNPEIKASEKDREFLEKIDKLLEQNKTIAKGLTMIEEKTRNRIQHEPPNYQTGTFRPPASGRPMPRF